MRAFADFLKKMPGRKSYTIEQKLEVIDRIKNELFGSCLHPASRALEIDRKYRWAWIDKENVFLNMESRRHKRRTGKPRRKPAVPN